jgi:hypothetical protein
MPDVDIALATQPVRWGVLGTAMIATTRTMPAMAQSPSSRLLAIASRRREQAERVARELGVPRVHGSYDELLADPDVDAVYVPLPNDLHVKWAARAMEAGKDVLCEKPLCLRADDVTALCAVRDRTGRHIEEAFGFRNHPQWSEIAALLQAGTISEVRSLQATLAKQFLGPADIRNDPARVAGTALEVTKGRDSVLASLGRVCHSAAAAASATAWSCSPSPPLTPTAPTIRPSRCSGIPPAKIMMRLSFEAAMP